MISTKVTQTKPSGAAFHEPSAEKLAYIRTNYIEKKKLGIKVEGSGDTRIVTYNFASQEARDEFDADPAIVAMLQEGKAFNTSNSIASESIEVL
ncbi:hypothetical protein UFOVP71_297 [uncultured Caudovirales phage]|uniref:Uncharacterized protein n=1 Tax=uncultured Caudovirales phage TaxID=2100421 RepID=A0A6J5TBT2_9CAUD|nr:hypothetical protein UFOVP71_297 [uncultured Caudovirales phage]